MVFDRLKRIQVHLDSILVGQWSDVVVLVERVADAQLLVGTGQHVFDLVVDGPVDDQTARGGATLTARSDSTKHRCGHHHVEIGVRCDDDGVVSTQFEQGTAQSSADCSTNGFTHSGASGRTNERNAAIGADLLTDVGVAVHDTRQGRRNTIGFSDLVPNVLASNGAERALFRRLQTQESPQIHARAVFQAQTATGKLKAEMIPTTPSGWYCSNMRCSGRSECVVIP